MIALKSHFTWRDHYRHAISTLEKINIWGKSVEKEWDLWSLLNYMGCVGCVGQNDKNAWVKIEIALVDFKIGWVQFQGSKIYNTYKLMLFGSTGTLLGTLFCYPILTRTSFIRIHLGSIIPRCCDCFHWGNMYITFNQLSDK